MTVSIRTLAVQIGITDSSISLLHDFFGYVTGVPDVLDVDANGDSITVAKPLSLLEQVELLQGHFFQLNVIRVGFESFSNADDVEIDFGLRRMREIYGVSSVRIGIGRITHTVISNADAAAKLNVVNGVLMDDDAENITDKYNGPAGGLDMFVLLSWKGNLLGRSAVDGGCDNTYDAFEMSGSVVSIDTSSGRTARTFAHEVAHYLGLDHLDEVVYPVCDPGPGMDITSQGDDDTVGSIYNLMADPDLYQADPERPEGECNYTVNPDISVDLSPAQGETMRCHCMMRTLFPLPVIEADTDE